MKLYVSPRAPSPRRVTMFLAEKGVTDLKYVTISIADNEHKSEAFLAKSPQAKLPALELEDGRIALPLQVRHCASCCLPGALRCRRFASSRKSNRQRLQKWAFGCARSHSL